MKGKVKKEEIKFEKYQKIVDKIVSKDNKQNNKDNNKNNNNMNSNSNSNSNITKNKNKIQYSVECGRKKIVPREKYFINAFQKEEEKKVNKKNLRYKLVKGKDTDINEGIVYKDQKIYMYTPKYDDNEE